MSFEDYFNRIVENVNINIEKYLKGDIQELYEASFYLFKAGGKRLRPLILVSSADLLGGDLNRAYLAGASVEVLHTFTLIHDDIMDEDTTRRGMPTVHVKWGIPMAILAGDLLHAKAFEILNEAFRGMSSNKITRAFEIFTKAIIIISEGQALDMQFEDKVTVSEEEYLDMIKRKTAMLFSSSAALGGLIATDNEKEIQALADYGLNLGISFQIVDDILGLIADEKELGKPVYSDIREGKKTLLVIKTMKEATDEEKKILLKALGNKNASKDELITAAEIIRKYSLEYAYNKAEEYARKAIEALESIDWKNDEAGKALKYLAEFTVKRRK
ncbi:geranylgeranyl diphosphate synthase [Sulfurisphaera tokodaii]|uniref:Multifunctional geranylgeranyl diphosphate synthase n=2 Tax=Sulfurisphaera tokodaii TaxID=111955 RepID=F9VP77_SULTO|nr:geranylgeranyl diphosphate synthase [Sulfurisphaera tokodaii]BAK54724.1 multifunctional geranylgeranyl diphosphate synthase [Sulfurisphaera tokodaii str. 7]HII72889.1 polyprenyl synthetase family protein [Sulfurisphaera tokodaii]